MQNFIENYLKIDNYEIKYFTNWRNNITALVTKVINNIKIIIQKESINFPENQKFLINELIKNWENINLALNYWKKRFVEFEWAYYQVMKYIESKTFSDKEFSEIVDENIIISLFEYLANFHNISEKINISEEKKDIWKTFKSANELFIEAEELNKNNSEFKKYFQKIIDLIQGSLASCIIETWKKDFSSWIIHWDSAFKNFLFDKEDNLAISLIDYEKVEYNNYLWDIADLIRSLLKIDIFDENICKNAVNKYLEIRKINEEEKNYIIKYTKTLVFHVILQYFLALIPEWSVENKIWDTSDSIKKLERWFLELKKIENWVI